VVNTKFIEMTAKAGTTNSEVLRRGLGLYYIAAEAKEQGLKLGLLMKDRTFTTEGVGI
jgi:hypothetical protein